MRGTTLDSYAQSVVGEVVSVGRAGTLVDWHADGEDRAYVSMYAAESILNWQQTRIADRLRLTLVVLEETAPSADADADPFTVEEVRSCAC